jgi:kynurenine formamidase
VDARRVQNLTLPISPYFPIGAVFPWQSAYWTEEIATIERNVAHLFYINMGSDTGTRLMGPAMSRRDGQGIQNLPLSLLVNRMTTVLRIAKPAGEAITPEDVVSAFDAAHDLHSGDAILVATGWGDDARWQTLGEAYALESPYFTPDAANTLLERMHSNASDLLLTDCAHLDRAGGSHARAEWATLAPWLRPTWPSEQAKAYLRHYTPEKMQEDWAATLSLTRKIWVVAGLANCGQLGVQRVSVTLLPMFVQDAGIALCTVMAQLQV